MRNLIYVSLSSKEVIDNSVHYSILQELEPEFDVLHVFCWGKKKHSSSGKFHFHSGKFIIWLATLRRLPAPTLIYATDYFVGGLFSVFLQKWGKCPLFLRVGSPWVYELNSFSSRIKNVLVKRTKKWVLPQSTTVIYNSHSIIEKSIPHASRVIYNGVDTDLFVPATRDVPLPKGSPLRLIYIGNLNFEKGLNYLFEALSLHSPRNKNINLTIVGDGPLFHEYQQKYPRFSFLGRLSRDALPSLLQEHDVLILPSLVESFPNVLLEAMACGKPVIASKVFGIPEMVADGYNGFLVPPKDTKAMADAIERFLEYPALCVTMGKNARRTVEERFDQKMQMRKLREAVLSTIVP